MTGNSTDGQSVASYFGVHMTRCTSTLHMGAGWPIP